ncbi:TonB-dependent receptor [Petrimonas sulfuriphila]
MQENNNRAHFTTKKTEKFFTIMKIYFLIALLCIFSISAENTYSQSKTVNAELKNVTLREALQEIEKNSDYLFLVMDNTESYLTTKVNISINNKSMVEILDLLLKNTNLTYSIVNRQITISRKPGIAENKEIDVKTSIKEVQQTEKTITGVVTNANGEAIIGANIIEVGTPSHGTITDINGRFTLNVSNNASIKVSFIGYLSQTINTIGKTSLNITLAEDTQALEEVVVVGYGTQRKENLTGAVSTVDVERTLKARPITDVGRALQGSAPGLVIKTTSGVLGGSPSIRIRGTVSTIGGGSGNPLILVDNVEVPDLSYVNPDNIKSISVLKDASTTAIYGARAAFGALLITTKKGDKDRAPRITYSNNFSWSTPTDVPKHTRADLNLQYSLDQANALRDKPLEERGQVGYYYNADVIKKVKEWIDTYGDGKGLGREMVEGRDFDYRPSGGVYYYRPWDIYKIYYKNWTPQQNQNISVNGGTEKTQYNLSAAYMNQKGILKLFDDFYRRYNISGYLSTDVKDWITLRGQYMLSKVREESPFTYGSEVYQPIYYLYRWHQVYPYGTYNGHEFRGAVNDLKSARPVETDRDYSRYVLGTTVKLAKGLTADFDYTYAQTYVTNHTVGGYISGINQWNVPKDKKLDELYGIYTSASYDYARYTSSKNIRNTYNGYLTYENKFQNHELKITAGTNIEDAEYIWMSTRRNGVYDFDKGEVNLAGGDQLASSSHSWWSVAGFFGRINYSFLDRYLLEVSGRYDGSSRFERGKRWDFFPSLSAGWRMGEESFMKPLKPILSSLKIRGTYGSVGNQDVPLNSFISTLKAFTPSGAGNYWLINGNFVPYISSGPTLVNSDLTWEKVESFDLGLDAGFLDQKINVTFDWYNRKTLNMLAPGETVPSTVGIAAPKRNFGELATKGVELEVRYNKRFENGLRLFVSGQFTDYKTVVTKYASPSDPRNSDSYWEGKVLGQIWGYKTDGLFQKEDFVWEGDQIKQTILENGLSKNTMAPGVPDQYILESGLFKFGPGDVKFKDLNGDGVIDYGTNTVGDPGDRTVIGNTTPRYQYGFRFGGTWKGFDADVFFQGVGKRHIWATGNMVLPGYYAAEANFAHTLDYWTPENTGAFYPRPLEYSQTAKWNYLPNDRYLLNAAYMRLKSLNIGYSLPEKLLKYVSVEKCRLYCNGENLFEFDKMGKVPIDPEIDWVYGVTANDSRSFGRSYPYRRTISFGLQVEF